MKRALFMLAGLAMAVPVLAAEAERRGCGFLVQDGLDPRGVAAGPAEARGVLKLAGRLLEAEIEAFLLEIAQATLKLFRAQFADFSDLCQGHDRSAVGR